MKKFRFIFITALVLTQLAFYACNKDEEEVNLLLGSWKYSELIEDGVIDERLLTFNADFSGNGQSYFIDENDTVNFDSYNFDYSVEENTLSVFYKENNTSDEIVFTIIDNSLIINAFGVGLEYKRI